ncbi:TadE/TadG family type IV pilus assembly protein [Novosphingobium sp.]|uniref:TadE/TadG family type IV pilus assembly protein n=1 Tax=Novosphingobium sp. TaxID=1874826 RepID=UPI002735B52C|nr:TadE/TadG family type IV pilus assembly protein [Novosphingobium sp.]MDP3907504.1 pilus assembly protein [Novosphingobium sp.]
MKCYLIQLWRKQDGGVVVEFALIAPAFLAMIFAVLQFGIGMQNYNALRSASADVTRYAVVNYQSANRLSDTQLQAYARSVAIRSPYGLRTSQLDVTIADAADQRVAGATEKTLTLTYRIPSMLKLIGVEAIPITYSRPVFLIES